MSRKRARPHDGLGDGAVTNDVPSANTSETTDTRSLSHDTTTTKRAKQHNNAEVVEPAGTAPQSATATVTSADPLSFASLPIDPQTLRAIVAMGFTRMTPVQARCIPALLNGVDVLGSAVTGSGKTLAFLIPAVELLIRTDFKARNGVGVLIITPTRELALQIYGVARDLCQFHHFTHGIVIGGTNRKAEVERLTKGVNLLVGTPGRILDHINNTKALVIHNLCALVLDEADRILEIGFEAELRDIVKRLPTNRQSMMFSATQTQNVMDIARISLRGKPVYIGVDDTSTVATAKTLEQGYVVCPSQLRFLLLFTFLKKNLSKKVIVFLSTCAATQFYSELLNYIDIPVLDLHGQQKQNKRTTTFFEFCNAQKGILLCTDVAARGLDIPRVDWIIQFDPPEDPKEYIHRVGRTARAGKSGRALLFLLPQELGFLSFLKAAKVPLNEYEFPLNKVANVQDQLEKLISANYYLHKSAREAYRSYMQSYAQHSLRNVFDVHALNVLDVAKSFGFEHPPNVPLKIALSKRKKRQDDDVDERDDTKTDEAAASTEPESAPRKEKSRNFSPQNPYAKAEKPQSRVQTQGKSVKQWAR